MRFSLVLQVLSKPEENRFSPCVMVVPYLATYKFGNEAFNLKPGWTVLLTVSQQGSQSMSKRWTKATLSNLNMFNYSIHPRIYCQSYGRKL